MSAQSERFLNLIENPPSLQKVILAPLGIGVAALCWGAVPALFDHGHVIDDMMQGYAIPTAVGLTCFLMITLLGVRSIILCKADGRSPWHYYWGMLGALFFIGMLAILFSVGRDYKRAVDLSTHGISTRARLVRQFTEGCSKHGCSTALEYSFVPIGRAEPVRGFANEGDTSRHRSDEYDYAISTGTIPIIYDQANPNRSMVNWNNQIQRVASTNFALKMIEIFTAVLLFAIALFGVTLLQIPRAISAYRTDQP